jgi:hypothetical protein
MVNCRSREELTTALREGNGYSRTKHITGSLRGLMRVSGRLWLFWATACSAEYKRR